MSGVARALALGNDWFCDRIQEFHFCRSPDGTLRGRSGGAEHVCRRQNTPFAEPFRQL